MTKSDKRGPYATEACKPCRESRRKCVVAEGTTYWGKTNPCVRCRENGFTCEKDPNARKGTPGRQGPSALRYLPILNNSLTKWQYQRCLEKGISEASQLFQWLDWSRLQDRLLSNINLDAANSEHFSPLLHCALILPHLHDLISHEDLKLFKGEAMAHFGREFLHPILATVLGTILLLRCPSIFDVSCRRDLQGIAFTWLSVPQQYDGLKHVSKTSLLQALKLLHIDGLPNSYCPCRGLVPASQTWPIANNPQSTDSMHMVIDKNPTDQISPHQSYGTVNVPFDLDPVRSINTSASPMNFESQPELPIPRTGSPTQNFSGIPAPYSTEAPPPYLNQPYPPQATVASPYSTLNSINPPHVGIPATSFVAPNQVFPPQSNFGGIQGVSGASYGSETATQGRGDIPQQQRKGSYAEVLRRGMQGKCKRIH